MTDQKSEDPRDILARMEAEERLARAKADELEAKNKEKKESLLKALRDADLADVIAKCKMHGFTATDLRSGLKTKGVSAKSTTRKSTKSRSGTRKKPA
jgi:hypothetical protein